MIRIDALTCYHDRCAVLERLKITTIRIRKVAEAASFYVATMLTIEWKLSTR